MSDAHRALRETLGDQVLGPNSDGYRTAMDSIFFSDAALSTPCCVVQPRSAADVATAMRIASAQGLSVTVRGGGLSAECAADGAVMLDLSKHLNTGHLVGHRARVGGGARMGTVLDTLEPIDATIPIGIAKVPGLGLATRGGVGHLTRSHGLTLDFLEEIEIVVPSGDVLLLSQESTGKEAELWWAIRGCAPQFGVVTAATFRSVPRPSVFVHRLTLPLEALTAYFEVAPQLPREISMSAVLGPPLAGAGEPVLFLITVYAGDDPGGIDQTRVAAGQVADGSSPQFETQGQYRYMDSMPEMSIPGLDGAEPLGPSLPVPGDPRSFLFSKCRFLGATLDSAVAQALTECARLAPTPLCRIDFQQTGGAIADVPVDDTSFWGRDSQWSNPINAMWGEGLGSRESCIAWARDTVDVLKPHQTGNYSVEVRSGLPETDDEVRLAFGDHLPRLQQLKRTWDPNSILSDYFPL